MYERELLLNSAEGLKSLILNLLLKKEYEQAIKICEDYLLLINSVQCGTEEDKLWNYWFVTYNTALCFKKLGSFEKAVKLAQDSTKYTNKHNTDYCYVSSKWLLGVCYMELNLSDEAIKCFKYCASSYKMMNEHTYRLCCLFNIAKSMKCHKNMLKIAEFYEKNIEKFSRHNDLDENELLEEMYSDIIQLYLNNDLVKNAYDILYGVKNRYLKIYLGSLMAHSSGLLST